jgi:hypothetical protein
MERRFVHRVIHDYGGWSFRGCRSWSIPTTLPSLVRMTILASHWVQRDRRRQQSYATAGGAIDSGCRRGRNPVRAGSALALAGVADRQITGAIRAGVPGNRGRTLLPRRPNDAQNHAATSGSSKMSANATVSRDADPKAVDSIKTRYRLAVAVSLIMLLSGAEISAASEDGSMATAPLPPPLPAAPPATGLQQPQGAARSPASPRVVSQSHLRANWGMQLAHPRKRNNNAHHVHLTRAARSEKRLGQRAAGDVERAEALTVPRVAGPMIPPFAPLPLPFGYIPSGPPAYWYALVYPPPWPSASTLPR